MHLLVWHAVLIVRFLIIGRGIPSRISLTGEHWRRISGLVHLIVRRLGRALIHIRQVIP
jgi:hypothetical protein